MSLEKFLCGQPLNEYLEKLAQGQDEESEQAAEVIAFPMVTGELTDDEREHLRRMTTEAGWRVLLKLLDTEIRADEDAAKQASMADPLGRETNLSAMWAEVSYLSRMRHWLEQKVKQEIGKLKRCAAGQTRTQKATS